MDYQDSINEDAGHYKLPRASHRDYGKKISNINPVDINEISSQFKHSTPDENNTLHLASMGGNISQVRYCLEVLKYDPNSFNQQGKNALHLAVQAGHDNITHYLAQTEVSLACEVENGRYTPLHLAALNGHHELVQFFVSEHEMDPLLSTGDLDHGITPLQCACINGNLAVVGFLTEEAKKHEPINDFINVTTSTGDTLLHSAALSGTLETTEYLVESCNMKPNPANDNGATPFHVAVYTGNRKLVILYMSCKDVNVTQSVESTGQNALHIAATQCHTDIVKHLIVNSKIDPAAPDLLGCTPLHYAALSGSLAIVEFLLDIAKGIDLLKVIDNEDQTVFHFAVRSGNLPLVKLLARYQRAVVSSIDKRGWSSLHHSVDTNGSRFPEIFSNNNATVTGDDQLKIIDFLVNEMKCDLTSRTSGGLTIHHLHGNLKIAQYLIKDLKCDPNSCDVDGMNALHHICLAGKVETVRYLVDECGYDLTQLDNRGHSVVHYACWSGSIDLLKFLLIDKRCEILPENEKGLTPLHYSAFFGQLNVVQFYKEQLGVDLNSVRTTWLLYHACMGGNLALVKYLLDECDYKELGASQNGVSLLQFAALHRYILEYLVIEKHCVPSYVDALGNTPLHDAMNLDSFKYLLNFIEYDKPNNEGVTPLHIVCEFGKLAIVRYLVKKCKVNLSVKCNDGRMPIHFAAQTGQVYVLKYLVEQGCNPSCTDSNGNTPLHFACSLHRSSFFHDSLLNGICAQISHFKTVEVLIRDYNCDPDCLNNKKQTPFYLACQYGYTEIVKYLVEKCKCNPYVEDTDKMVPLFAACQYGWVDIVKFLADYFENIKYKQISLRFACMYGQCEVVQYLVENLNCDVIGTDNPGLNPLWCACNGQHKEVIEYLTSQIIAMGNSAIKILLDYNATEKFGVEWISPLQVACEQGDLNTIKLLTSKGIAIQQTTLLHFACRGGKIDTIQYLIEEFAVDVNSQDNEGDTPLHITAILGHVDVIKYLIEAGCDPLCKNVYGNTPAHLAALNDHLPALKYFIEQLKLDLSIANKEGQMVIHYACCIRNIDIVRYLVEECSVDINSMDQEGNTPLLKAAMNGQLTIIEYLIKHGCDPVQRNTYGNTPLHLAASNGHLSVVKYYMKHLDHDPNTANDQGQNCLHIACFRGRMEVIRYLVDECSIDINSKDKEGSTPVILASINGHLAVVEYLITKGCDLLQRGAYGFSPTDAAIIGEQLSVLKYFKEKDCCDFKSVSNIGSTPIQTACALGNLDIVKYLVEECSVDFLSVIKLDIAQYASCTSALLQDEKTWLESLLPKPLLEVVNLCLVLSKQGVDPNVVFGNQVRLAPLHSAASNGHLLVVEYLIAKRCDPRCRDSMGNTPMHYAAGNGHLTVVKYFKQQQNCDLNTTNSEGQMAIHLASFFGKIDVVQYLVEECSIDLMNEDKLKDGSTPLVAAAMPQDNDGNTPLHFAVVGAQLEIVKFYINNLINYLGLDPNTPNNNGATPLHLGCQAGSLQIVKLFGECDICDFSAKDNKGRTLLHYVSWKSVDAVAIIIYLVRDKQCDPAISDNDENICLHLASQKGTLEVVRLLVCEFNCDPNSVNTQGETPLQLASEDSVIDFFLQLSSKDEDHHVLSLINPNLNILKQFTQDYTGQKVSQSPLLRAIELDKHDQVNYYILDKGCNLAATDSNGNTFLHIAALHGAIRVAQLLLNTFECDPNCENAQGATPLHLACAKGQKKIVNLLLNNYKCQTSSKDKNGQTPLHYAVLHSGLDIIEKLARQVCDLMIPDNTGHTPLHCAIQRKDVKILSFFLFEKECDLQVKNKDGNSYLHYAAKGGQLEIVHLICLMPDLNPCASNKYGCTPLDLATVYHNQEVVEFLQQHTTSTHSPPSVIHLSALLGHISSIQHYIADLQYDPDLRDSTGRTPLHYAAMGGHLIITQYLVSSDTDSLSEDVFHNLPLHYAAALGHQDVVQFLVNIGSPLTARGVWDKTPAEMAAAGGHKNVLDYLDSLQDDDGLDWVRDV